MTARLAYPADNDLLRSIVEHPDLARFNREDGAPDFDPNEFTAHPYSFGVMVEGGCFLAVATEARSYDIHTNMLPHARGAHALRAAREALHFAFTSTDAESLTTKVPANNPPALWFAHAMGFRDTFKRADAWRSGGTLMSMQYLRMDIDDWIVRSDSCSELGEAFHETLGDGVNHLHDPVHDAYVGAAVAMIDRRLGDKATRIYGRWARCAGYAPFTIESSEPLLVNIGTHRLRVDAGQFTAEKITCPQP